MIELNPNGHAASDRQRLVFIKTGAERTLAGVASGVLNDGVQGGEVVLATAPADKWIVIEHCSGDVEHPWEISELERPRRVIELDSGTGFVTIPLGLPRAGVHDGDMLQWRIEQRSTSSVHARRCCIR